jgi:transcriptional regulator with XRE-family HTH domain
MTTAVAADPDLLRRRELAAFLRSRRERISPEQVGLPTTGRRRTPGLRREEVAQLAAVGVTWYTWLEQGRDIQVSAQVLDAVARSLRLDPNERAHLFTLAATPDPSPHRTVCSTVTPAMETLLAQLEPYPACVQNDRFDILAYNSTYARLLHDLDAIPVEDRNSMLLCFTHPAWRTGMPDWLAMASTMVAKFRAAMADHIAEPSWKCLLKQLRTASPEFAEIWERREVLESSRQTKRYRNPLVGLLHFETTALWLGPRQGPRLIAYTPADEETRERVVRLHALVTHETGDNGRSAPMTLLENLEKAEA